MQTVQTSNYRDWINRTRTHNDRKLFRKSLKGNAENSTKIHENFRS